MLGSTMALGASSDSNPIATANGEPSANSPAQSSLLIQDVTVIDAVAGARVGRDVRIRQGRIDETAAELSPEPGERVVAASGKFLIPGLWDMHVHLAAYSPPDRAAYVGYGVTSVRDMGGFQEQILDLRRRSRDDPMSPSVYIAGPTLNGAFNGDFHRVVSTAALAQVAVSELVAAGVDHIKVHNATDREVFFAIARACQEAGVSLVGHVPAGVSAAEATAAGMRTIEHVEVLLGAAIYQSSDPAAGIGEALSRLQGLRGAALFREFARNGTAYTPTLVAYERFVDSVEDPEQRRQTDSLAQALGSLVPSMRDAGVAVLAGTDTPGAPGDSLHRELELLVQAGFPPGAALRAATLNPARVVGRDDVGAIQTGNDADLVLLDADPLADIRNTRTIAAVIVRGRYLDAETLATLRDAASPGSEDRR